MPKPGKREKRPLGIPTIFDRAKQSLIHLALEPQWEALFEPNSYGFRSGRLAQDAMEAIFHTHRKTPSGISDDRHIVDADLKGCFDNIDHSYLLNKLETIPVKNGFNFLGYSFIKIFNKQKKTYRIKIYPTKENQKRLIKNVGEICRRYRSISSYDLIQILRPKIIGWANYYRYCECSDTFKKMDHFIFRILRSWVFRRARKKGRLLTKEKYFPSGRTYYFDNNKFSDNWILYGKKRGKNGEILENFLPRLSWVKSIKHIKVRGNSSVYDGNHIYWINRLSKYPLFNTRIRKLIKRQKGICPFCKGTFDHNSKMDVDHIIPISQGGKDTYSNLQLLHRHCHVEKTLKERNSCSGAG
uniref:Putative reverse transcriptase and intron maturase n=1 Tax=Caulerpa lentillifera TaxID=148947 RepID=A0A345HH08_9CHLO|nr:putative reverse transcriptase and intron maturase [Caulerpa lentillifera]AXG75898.1 putative reverse transcriptase and intron maturase [Caulerpa lentillifera]QUV75634.1 hypothetical protein [Caulerpa lentillifera]